MFRFQHLLIGFICPEFDAEVYWLLHLQVSEALEKAGLESSNLIVGIDFTKSNEWTGKKSFMGRNLHDLDGACLNPYEQAISIIGKTLEKFDDDNIIPCYGFGDGVIL